MEELLIEATEETPEVFLSTEANADNIIKGRSLPENALKFYDPIQKWLTNYNKNISKNALEINIKYDYFNTSSAKQITSIFLILEEIAKHNKIKVNWYYQDYDSDIKQSGIRFSKLFKFEFNLILL